VISGLETLKKGIADNTDFADVKMFLKSKLLK